MNTLTIYEKTGLTPSQTQLIKDTVCKGATDEEFKLFLHICVKTGLDPLMKQIYSIGIAGKRCVIVSIDGLRLLAERSKKYAPGKPTLFSYDKDGKILSATAFVKKMTPDGSWHEISATAFFAEYFKPSNPMWKNMGHAMIAKCAEALALRKGWPADMSGLNTKEEMDQAIKKGNIDDILDGNILDVTEENKVVETDIEKDNLVSDFIRDNQFPDELHFDVRSFMFVVSRLKKQNMFDTCFMYKTKKRNFDKDFNQWREAEKSKKNAMAA